MGEVLTFSPMALNQAWEAYREFATRSVNNPYLLTDREFFDEYIRREDRYKKMLLERERR